MRFGSHEYINICIPLSESGCSMHRAARVWTHRLMPWRTLTRWMPMGSGNKRNSLCFWGEETKGVEVRAPHRATLSLHHFVYLRNTHDAAIPTYTTVKTCWINTITTDMVFIQPDTKRRRQWTLQQPSFPPEHWYQCLLRKLERLQRR